MARTSALLSVLTVSTEILVGTQGSDQAAKRDEAAAMVRKQIFYTENLHVFIHTCVSAQAHAKAMLSFNQREKRKRERGQVVRGQRLLLNFLNLW